MSEGTVRAGDGRIFPPLVKLLHGHIYRLLEHSAQAVFEMPHHPEIYDGGCEKITNALVERGVITMHRHCPPGHVPVWYIGRGPNFRELKGDDDDE